MTKFTAIQTMVCEDTIRNMKQAQKQKNEAAFCLEKSMLLKALEILKTADSSTYAKYFEYGEMTFYSDG